MSLYKVEYSVSDNDGWNSSDYIVVSASSSNIAKQKVLSGIHPNHCAGINAITKLPESTLLTSKVCESMSNLGNGLVNE